MRRAAQSGTGTGGDFRRTFVDAQHLAWIQGHIDAHPEATLESIGVAVCKELGWTRPDGRAPESSCRALLRRLEKRGLLKLPRGARPRQVGGVRARHIRTDMEEMLNALGPIPCLPECQPEGPLVVRPIAKEERPGFRLHMRRYHYLGYQRPVGESLRYAALMGAELVALLEWGAAVLHNGPRDEYVGWDSAARARRLPWVVNNRRFLMLPGIRQPNLASRVLAANLQRLSEDWEESYRHPVFLAETFVDSARFKGTCYRASNWQYLGETRGFSRTRAGFSPNGQPKSVFVYALHRHALSWLREEKPS